LADYRLNRDPARREGLVKSKSYAGKHSILSQLQYFKCGFKQGSVPLLINSYIALEAKMFGAVC